MVVTDVIAELRKAERHPCAMELRFTYQQGGVQYLGTGRTRDLSGEAVCFETDQTLKGKTELELHIEWPFRLQSVCPLELVVRGRVLRQNSAMTVVRMDRYEFRTYGNRSFHQTDSCGVTCNLAA